MGLFARDAIYGGEYFEETFPLVRADRDRSRNGRVLEESEDFIVWATDGITAENIRTSIGDDGKKAAFTVSTLDDPTRRIRVGTMATAIVGMIEYALDLAREETGRDRAGFEELYPVAFGDLPAVAKLQRVPSRVSDKNNALVLTLVCPLSHHHLAPKIAEAVRRAKRESIGDRLGDDAPW